jgi:hypothetical protein
MLIKFAKALNWILSFIVCENVLYENTKGTYYVTSIYSIFGVPVSQETKKVKDLVLKKG